jgi:hypothetical protein
MRTRLLAVPASLMSLRCVVIRVIARTNGAGEGGANSSEDIDEVWNVFLSNMGQGHEYRI